MTDILLIVLLLLSAVLLVVLLKRQPQNQSGQNDQSALLMQQQVESLRSDMRASLQQVTDNVSQQLVSVTNQIQSQTTNVGSRLQQVTESVNQQLNTVTQQIQSQTSNVGDRLDNAARVIGEVQKNLGELGQATKEIKELGQSVSKLEELLRAPKLRGGLGEYLLEDLLKQVLPSEHFEMQYHFRNGQVVDAIIKTSNHIVPVDSKFPLENFRKMISAENDAEKKNFQKAFLTDVKKHIDAIASKYILPDEGTFPFALMYIPAENIYYEVIIKDEGVNRDSGLYNYAVERKVVPVSPNSFYAYLQVIALGLRGMYVEKQAQEILNSLTRLQGDMGKVREVFDVLGTHIDNAQKKYGDADKRLTSFEGRLENIAEHSLPEGSSKQLLNS
jgi:DNA recombination protein RmuC